MRRRCWPAARRALAAVGLVLALAGCEMRVELHVDVEDDGSGDVEVAVGLDEEAMERRPDLADDLDVEDLLEAGWEITGPTREAGSSDGGGWTWIRARHPFSGPEQLGPLIDQVTGPDGPFRGFSLRRSDDFAETTYRLEGQVDFRRGLDDVTGDAELAEALGADPAELLTERLGAVVDELVTVQVAARLPGEVRSNAPTQADNGAVWRPSVLERDVVEISASGTVRRTERLVWAGVAAAAGLALVLFVAIRLALWRRRRSTNA